MNHVAQTIEQQRAAFALGEIRTLLDRRGDDKPFRKEFRSYASALPAMIHMNGLGQAAAFCRAKGGTYGQLYEILSRWMVRDGQPFQRDLGLETEHGLARLGDDRADDDLLAGIVSSDMYHYRVAQAEALALLGWVKKFALAFMAIEDDEPETGPEEAA